jgi:Asp-tRNA(Asn)/Glu-tRNA(Gln) amidotransferase A subunit family amidase
MKPHSPFDHRPDRELGSMLRDWLQPDDRQAFGDRVLRRIKSETGGASTDWWDVLNAWARPGLIAAAVLAAIGIVGVVRQPTAPLLVALEDTLSEVPDREERETLLDPSGPPDFGIILTSGVEIPTNR